MKKSLIVILLALFFFSKLLAEEKEFIVQPPRKLKNGLIQIYGLYSVEQFLGTPQSGSLKDEMLFAEQVSRTAYVRGYMDALLLTYHTPKLAKNTMDGLQGMSVEQIIDSIKSFYSDYPYLKDKYFPSGVISNVLPRLRKGLPPIEPENERTNK